MKKQIVDRLFFGSRIVVVTLALLALVVSGAGAAARLFAEAEASPDAPPRPQNATLDNIPGPDEAAGEMATGGRPWTEQSAYVQAHSALLEHAPTSRHGAGADLARSQWSGHLLTTSADPITGSPTVIDHRLGHRFTLVGHKPSGTS